MVKTKAFLLNAISALYLLTTPVLSLAAENGTGVYLLGSKDRQMAVFRSQGIFLRTDFAYMSGTFYGMNLQGHKFESIKNWVAVSNTTMNYYSGRRLFGGTYMASMEFRIVSNELTLVPEVPNGITKHNESKIGLGDLKVTPIAIGWNNRYNLHYSANLSFYFPTGSYDADQFCNTNSNHIAIGPEFAMTYYNEFSRTDISASTGFIYNFQNPATGIQSGPEWQMEYAFVQGVERRWGLGLVGYFYYQLSPDTGGDEGENLMGRCNGFGPILTYEMYHGKYSIGLMTKMYLVYGNQNTLNSNSYWLGLTLKFW